MTVLHTAGTLAPSIDPISRGTERLRLWRADPTPEPRVIPALDVAALQLKYGPDQAFRPRGKRGVMRVPLNCPLDLYERVRNQKIRDWINAMGKRGWDWTGSRVTVTKGMYPAQFDDGMPDLGMMEMNVYTTFVYRHAKAQRIELKPSWLRATRIAS